MPGAEMIRLAKNLVEHGAFENPFGTLATGPTAANPPLYPLLLAFLFKLIRLPAYVYVTLVMMAVFANAFTASLLPRLSRAIMNDCVPGIFAGALWLAAMQSIPGWDTNLSVLGILLFCLVTHPSELEGRRPLLAATMGGILSAILFLLNPSIILIVVPWVGYIWLISDAPKLTLLKETALLIGILGAFGFGWMLRNDAVLGAFVVRTNLGMTLYASNNDCARSSLIRDEFNNCYQTHHPSASVAEAKLLATLGEVRYDRTRIADTEAWVRSHPARFTRLTLRRFVEFWFPAADWIPPTKKFETVFSTPQYTQKWSRQQIRIAYVIWFVTALSIPGLLLLVHQRKSISLYFMVVLTLYPVMYYVVVTDVRYRYPVLWISLLSAGYLIREILDPQRKNEVAD